MLRHADTSVCSPELHDIPHYPPPTLRQLSAPPHTVSIAFSGAYSSTCCAPNRRSNPIAHRVRRKRQRLPPSLLIENASDRRFPKREVSCPRRFRSRLATIDELAFVTTGCFSVRISPPSDHVLTTLVPRRSNRMTKTLDEIGATRCQEHPCVAAAMGGRYGVNRRLRTMLDDTLLRNPEQ